MAASHSQTAHAQAQFDKMTKTPVHKLILQLSVPTIISMLVTNIYNMADTYFVSDLGTSASGATGIVFALMAIIQAFGFMCGHGSGSHLSRLLGKRDVEQARTYGATGFYLSLICGSVILVLGLSFQEPFMRLLGSTDSILPYAKTYSTYILLAAPAMASSCVLNNILRYEGKASFAMIGLTSGSILNIFGDWFLITKLDMGIAGAGLSTAVSQYISLVILMIPFLTEKVETRLKLRYVTNNRKVLMNIFSVGMPSLMRQGLNSISVMVLNLCAKPYGDAAIAAMSIDSRIVNFMFCICIGIGQGFQPVSAFNYGARLYKRVKEACKFTCMLSMVFMGILGVLGIIFAPDLVAIFREDADVIRIGAPALRFQCIFMVISPISVCGNMLFQSVGKGALGTFLASIRNGCIYIPILILFSQLFGLTGIIMSQGITDLLTVLITIPFLVYFFRKLDLGLE